MPSPATRPARTSQRPPAAEKLPVARVAVDVPLAHLDRPFDYLVPATLDEAAVPGCRVRVRFAGRLTGGYLLERAEASDHQGTLAFLERVLSPEPVLTPEVAGLARAVAEFFLKRQAASEMRQRALGIALVEVHDPQVVERLRLAALVAQV